MRINLAGSEGKAREKQAVFMTVRGVWDGLMRSQEREREHHEALRVDP